MSGNKKRDTCHSSSAEVVERGETVVSNAMRVSPLPGTYTACF